MTTEQIQVMIASLDILQTHLDERVQALNETAKSIKDSGSMQGYMMFSTQAEIYTALGLVNTAQRGAYQSMLVLELRKQNNEAN